MIGTMFINNDPDAVDWDWGRRFVMADVENNLQTMSFINQKVQYVRQSSRMSERDPTRLPYLGADGQAGKDVIPPQLSAREKEQAN